MSKPTHDKPTKDQAAGTTRVAVVGYGLTTPLGDGAWPTFRALLAGRTLADRAAELPPDTAPLDLARALGCVASVQHSGADPAVSLAERAAREATTMAGIDLNGLPIWLGTSKGAVAKLSSKLSSSMPIDEDTARCITIGPHAEMAQQLAHRLHTTAMPHYVAACSSGLYALNAARRAMLEPTGAHYALIASADAAITPAFFASYRRLGVLGNVTTEHYNHRPMDERRQGFMLSEMGVAVLLKRIEPDETMPEHAVELADTDTATEPFDMVRSPEQMTSLTRLWQRVSAGRCIDVIHPHAPGTREHDPAELGVLLQTPSPAGASPLPDLYAVKGAIGHGLGASGLASLVVAAMCLRTGKRPPMPWLSEPMTLPDGRRLAADPHAHTCARSGCHAVLAAGFGGHLAAAVLQA